MARQADLSDSISMLVQEAHDRPIQPVFTSFITSNCEVLSNLITRRISIIRHRSTKLQDNQVTIYDKALLALTRDGHDLTFPPALRFFCIEHLGIEEDDLGASQNLVLDQYNILPNTIDQDSTIVASQRDSLIKTEPEASTTPPLNTVDIDLSYKRLIAVYEEARSEFLAVADNDDYSTIHAAKFLRDTVENVLDNLKGKQIDVDKHAELRNMARTTKDIVEKLCGGRKRKFDPGAKRDEGRARPPSPSSSDRIRYAPRHHDYPYTRREWRNDERRHGRERSSMRGYGYIRQQSPELVRVPYGYSRPVDSYHPA